LVKVREDAVYILRLYTGDRRFEVARVLPRLYSDFHN